MNHRTPPKPPHFDTAPLGTCRWCNLEIGTTKKGKPSKARWHQSCVKEYKMLFWPTTTRRAVYKRDKGICASCGTDCKNTGKWHMDHIKPLVEAKGDITYWQMPNLQTLCTNCHNKKTAKEATDRAAARRQLKEKNDPSNK